MKLKLVLIMFILTVSSVYAKSYKPNYDDEAELLEWCQQYADLLGYDRSQIVEAHYVSLPSNILGKCYYLPDNKAMILVNRLYPFSYRQEFDTTLVHEVCHVYTKDDLSWHIAMIRAANTLKMPGLKFEILQDEATDHPLD